jgi:hypothetical protein
VQAIAVFDELPVDEIGRARNLDIGPVALRIGGIGEEAAAIVEDHRIGKIGLEHRDEGLFGPPRKPAYRHPNRE